jgi:hypothetical protein
MRDELAAARRDARIVELRAQRVPFAEIARELKISRQRVHQLWSDILDRIPAAHLDKFRQEERELADHAVRDLLTIISDPTATHGSRIRSWEVMVKWAERRARLDGLDAPLRREIEIHDTSGWEYQLRATVAQGERELRTQRALEASFTEEENDQ